MQIIFLNIARKENNVSVKTKFLEKTIEIVTGLVCLYFSEEQFMLFRCKAAFANVNID